MDVWQFPYFPTQFLQLFLVPLKIPKLYLNTGTANDSVA
jgi:hypothetical protein